MIKAKKFEDVDWKNIPANSHVDLTITYSDRKIKVKKLLYCHYVIDSNIHHIIYLYADKHEDYYSVDIWNKNCVNEEYDESTLYENEIIDKTIEITKSNNIPLVFISIDKKYLHEVNAHYKKLHLATDFMDQGWCEYIEGRGLDHLTKYNEDLFFVDGNDITIWAGEGLWINKNNMSYLEQTFQANLTT
jgi:hypothetical protein